MPDDAATLRKRILAYRRAAAAMLTDWYWGSPETFKNKHMELLRKMVKGELEEFKIRGLDSRRRKRNAGI